MMLYFNRRAFFLSHIFGLSLSLTLTSCGGGGGNASPTPITFGGATCESGYSFGKDTSQGYDALYNFTLEPQPKVVVVFDPSGKSAECAGIASAAELFPWIRIDVDLSGTGESLKFEMVQPGGRNEPIIATYAIPDASLQSIHGTFAYQITKYLSSVNQRITCNVSYDGSYCPSKASSQTDTMDSSSAMDFSADGTVECTIPSSSGAAPTVCRGSVSATNVKLSASYYGE
jgi:hypothetical protein